MSDWQPIETAPTDQSVLLGRWIIWGTTKEWYEDIGIPYRSSWLGWSRSKTFDGHRNTHWRPLPPPPLTTRETA